MAAERNVFDVDECPDLIQLVDHIRESRASAVLRQNGRDVALVVPMNHRRGQQPHQRTQRDLDAFIAAAGGWKGLVDGEKLLADIYADRDLEMREVDER